MKKITIWILAGLLTAACGGREEADTESQMMGGWPTDTAWMKVAVMPTLDCLPLYVAADKGMFERHGASVSLYDYESQMDCDTALVNGWVNAMVTDLVRARRLQRDSVALSYLTATDLHWQLLALPQSQVERLGQLEHKMVAMTRFSATAMLADQLVASAGINDDYVFRIQVNSLAVRLSMMEAGIMDVSFLPEPQATAARLMDCRVVYDTQWNDVQMGAVVLRQSMETDTLCDRQKTAFLQAYNEACDSINTYGVKTYGDLIRLRCHVDTEVVDSLSADIRFSEAHQPRRTDIDRADKWLEKP